MTIDHKTQYDELQIYSVAVHDLVIKFPHNYITVLHFYYYNAITMTMIKQNDKPNT